jgi:predicted ATPase
MAYMTKNIPTLKGTEAKRFQQMMDEAYNNKGSLSSQERRDSYKQIMKNSEEFFKHYKWNF